MTTPTQVLREEHRLIVRALDTLEIAGDRVGRGAPLPDHWWSDLIHWLRAFADRNHHAKEERSLFPAMVKAGVPSDDGPIAVMLEEHSQGRALIQSMETVEPAHRAATVRDYVALLRAHIDKENQVVFPLADAVLEEPAQKALAREFDAIEAEQGHDASLERAEAYIARLAAALG